MVNGFRAELNLPEPAKRFLVILEYVTILDKNFSSNRFFKVSGLH